MTGRPAAQAISSRLVTPAGPAVLTPERARGGWLWERTFPGATDQVRQVRAAVRSLMDGCDAQETVVHLLSELSANAVVHSRSGRASGEFIVRLQHAPCRCVWAEVEDAGSEEWGGDLAASARERSGLFIVMALASACGVAARPGGCRAVWFRIPCQQAHAGDEDR
ncbi:MAG: ATP-binding protein [Streptosporangiaceae bacterium]